MHMHVMCSNKRIFSPLIYDTHEVETVHVKIVPLRLKWKAFAIYSKLHSENVHQDGIDWKIDFI